LDKYLTNNDLLSIIFTNLCWRGKMKIIKGLILLLFMVFSMQGISFSQDLTFLKDMISQAEIVDLTVKITGLEFFVSKDVKARGDQAFEFKKKIASMHYPVLKKAERDKPADCCFVSKVIYQIVTPEDERGKISCEGAINCLQAKGYAITCKAGQVVDKPTVLNLFRDPKLVKEVMEKVDTAKSSPYSTQLSESYSTPASKAK